MRQIAQFRFLLLFGFLVLWTHPAWAYKTESRIPLMGCRGHYSASGSARYVKIRSEKKTDEEELQIVIHNVPLKPGTVLFVFVAEEPVGTIKLDSKQSGKLTLTSSFGKFVPPITSGTSVIVKTVDGRYVMW